MNNEPALKKIEGFVESFTSKSETVFPVEIKMSPANDIKVFLDDDNGITIEKCTILNKALYKNIEEEGLFPAGNFSLEVSSPGIDEPLKLYRQYKKNINRKLEVVQENGDITEGILLNVTNDSIGIEEKKGKGNKTTTTITTILFNEIKHAKVLVTF